MERPGSKWIWLGSATVVLRLKLIAVLDQQPVISLTRSPSFFKRTAPKPPAVFSPASL